MTVERKRIDLAITELKLAVGDDKTGAFSGYGAVFGNVDSYGDVIERGAFKRTLREWEERAKLPPMLLQHGGFFGPADDWLPIGRWTSMTENAKGLKVEGELFALGTERGQYLYEGLKAGVLDGLSIGYRVVKFTQGTKPTEPRRKLEQVDLVEVSVVTFPANDKARVGAVKQALERGDFPTERDFERLLTRDAGFSRSEALVIINQGFKALRTMRDAGDGAADYLAERMRRLAEAIHPNP